ncbi:hypothetical protein EC973_001462 [Apophysomyces ossiformis]|uniref:Pentatricopeptide repeat-containing protein n=1 Tax=Apophysomyces ossiformis TaxID=679940 RepID=A0A8H7BJK8_9FUNG|nr:hypothetical protein EC973_001462 [Apophysomyces ossiformis]
MHALFEQRCNINSQTSRHHGNCDIDWKEMEAMFHDLPIVKNRHTLYSQFSKLPIETILNALGPWLEQARVNDVAGQRVWRVIKDMSAFWDIETKKAVMETVDDDRLRLHLFGLQLPEYRRTKDLDTLLAAIPSAASDELRLKLYNTMLNVCLRQGKLDHVEQLILRMKDAVKLDAVTFNVWIRTKLVANDVIEANAIYENMIESGIKPTVVTYNTFLKYACREQRWDEMTLWLNRLQSTSKANSVTLRILLGAVSEYKDHRVVSAFSRVVISCSFALPSTEPLLNPCVTALLRHKRTDAALQVLKRLFVQYENDVPTLSAFNLLIHALAQKGECKNAHEILRCMMNEKGLPNPDIVSFATLIHGYLLSPTSANVESVLELYQQMRNQGISSNTTLQSILLNTIAKSRFADIHKATALFQLMIKENEEQLALLPNERDQSTVYDKINCLSDRTVKVDTRRSMSQSVMYNVMMDGYFTHHRKLKQAHAPYLLLREAAQKQILTTSTLNIWVRGLCLYQNNLSAAERIVDWFERQGISMNERTAWYLVKGAYMLNRVDRAKHWLHVFEEVKGHVIYGSGLRQLKMKILKETSKAV